MNLEHIIEAQSGLIDALRKFAAGELEPAAFKPFGAPLVFISSATVNL